jgi:PhnB protein
MRRATPYLNFPGTAEEAFAFYRSVFGGEYSNLVRYRDMGMADDDEGDLVAHVSLPIADDTELMGSDVSRAQAQGLRVGDNVQIHLAATDAAEARRVFEALADGGAVEMPLERTSWSDLFGACVDRYGVHWMVDYADEASPGAA